MSKAVAIIGRSYLFPTVSNIQFDEALRESKSLITSIEQDRWSLDSFQHPQKSYPGTTYTSQSGSIGDVSKFDATFFGISPREAAQIDPQHRFLLELSWQAFEDAGIKPSSLRGSQCGVYIGISSADYSYRLAEDLASMDSSVATGNTASIAANRISYFFDLHGPSMAIDTACSSSLVAFHQACQAIRSGEITHALTGGISLHLHPYGFIAFSKASMLSPNGHCNVFDESGDGYVRSEGGGIFLLKEYGQAIADGDRILAVVASTSVNTDGKKSGLTIPNPESQARLLETAYSNASISADQISYIEAHGTGTAVGDPIEAFALGTALGQKRLQNTPLPIGSIKSNLGHLEAASGVAGLAKALYVIENGVIPPTIGIKKLNTRIDFDDLNLEVVTSTKQLTNENPIIVGVNSFGFGGANAHVILRNHEENAYTDSKNLSVADSKDKVLPILISAANPAALKDAARNLSLSFSTTNSAPVVEHSLYDIGYQLAFRREAFSHRAVVFGQDIKDICRQLNEFADDSVNSDVSAGEALISDPFTKSDHTFAQGPVFVYSGNGSQWMGMGRKLLDDPVFKASIEEIDYTFFELAGFSIAAQLQGLLPDLSYTNTDIAQPSLFAIQVGITRMLESMGVKPKAVSGHSVGEVAAAWAAEILDLKSATEVIFHRSCLQHQTKGLGKMTAVALGAETTNQWLIDDDLIESISIASVNSPRGVTLAGTEDALAKFESRLTRERTGFKRLDLDYAFHSPAMDSIEFDVVQSLAHIKPVVGSIPFYSSVTGQLMDGRSLDSRYWWKNIRNPVLFDHAINALLEDGNQLLIEIGPQPILKGYLNDCINQCTEKSDKKYSVIQSLSRQNDSVESIQKVFAETWIAGAEIDLNACFPNIGRHIKLPFYPWQRERHWHQVSAESQNTLNRVIEHPLLGYEVPQHDLLWENKLDPYKQPFLADHVVGDAIVFPGTGYVELALAAAHAWHPGDVKQIEDLEILSPITFNTNFGKVVRTWIDAADGRITIQSRDFLSTDGWTINAKARIILETRFNDATKHAELELASTRIPDFDQESHSSLTKQLGLQYGDAFKAIRHGWNGHRSESDQDIETVTAVFTIPQSITASVVQFHLHPALLDCSFQLIIQMLRDLVDMNEGIAYLPTQIGRITVLSASGTPNHVQAKLLRKLPHSLLAEFTLFDANGYEISRIEKARFRRTRLQKVAVQTIDRLQTVYIPQPLQPGLEESQIKYLHVLEAVNELARRSILDKHYRNYVDELDPLLDMLCNAFAIDILTKLGFTEDHDVNQIILNDLKTSQNNQPELLAHLDHIIQLGLEDGRLIENDHGIALIKQDLNATDNSDTIINALSIWNTLLADYPDFFKIIHTIGQIGQHLPEVLKGNKTIDVLLDNAAQPAYLLEDLIGNKALAKLAQTVFDQVNKIQLKALPRQRIGVLEVAATKPLFMLEIGSRLKTDQTDLIYACADLTDIDHVDSMIESCTDIKLDSFEVESDQTNPFAPSDNYRADLAIVWLHFESNELNNKAIDYGIKHLKSGGILFVIGLHRTRWLDFIYGAKTGWWMHTGNKKLSSLQRDRSMWESRLASMGLNHVRHMESTHDAKAGAYLLIAQNATSAKQHEARHSVPRSWLLIDDESDNNHELREAICKQLQVCGDIVSVLRQNDSATELTAIKEHIQTMRSHFGEIDGVIHIKGLGCDWLSLDNKSLASGNEIIAQLVDRCMSTSNLIKACQLTDTTAQVYVITKNAISSVHSSNDSMLTGFIRSMMNEVSSNRIKLIDLNTDQINANSVSTSRFTQEQMDALTDELTLDSLETEVVLTNDMGRFVPRLRPTQTNQENLNSIDTSEETIKLKLSQPGQLRNLQWQIENRQIINDDEVEIDVEATGLNFRDVMYALGLLSDEAIENGFAGATIGLECAGTITRLGKDVKSFEIGERVVGFGPACFANRVVTKANAIAYIPRSLSAEAAATIASTFLTSYYALVQLGRLEAGEKILIHGAAGGVGLAAIQIARWCGAEIFATAGSEQKRDLLRMMGVNHVLDSRSLSFADDIMTITQGKGIDMVLNSLAGEAINRNLSVLKPFGRFLELGKRDFYENTRIGLRPFRNNITYFGIDADQLMNERPELTAKLFGEVMDLFEKGVLHPLPYTRFEAREVVEAFRYMQQSQQIGKIVVTYRNGIPSNQIGQQTINLAKTDKCVSLELDPNASYVVTGGLGGFGLRTALWLAEKGARHLILLGRRGAETVEAQNGIHSLETLGVKVSAYSCDVTDSVKLTKILEPWLNRIKGIVHAAAVIKDGIIENLGEDQLQKVLEPKIIGALNLHYSTRDQALDFFVMYSSATTLFGNPGQAAYVAANTGLEALASYRRAQGLTATCMLWGAIDDAGFLARNQKIKDALQHRMGGRAINSAAALIQLEHAILNQSNNEGVLDLDINSLFKFLPSAITPKFDLLRSKITQANSDQQHTDDIPRMLIEMNDRELLVAFMEKVKNELSKILRISADKIDTTKSIYDMGLDSLMGVELVVALEAKFGIRLSVMAVSENPSIEKLTLRLISQLRSQGNSETESTINEIAKQHGAETTENEISELAESIENEHSHQAGRFLQ